MPKTPLIWMLRFFIPLFIGFQGTLTAQNLPGMIPLEGLAEPANDLVYENRVLFPEEVFELYQSRDGLYDLARLNPREDSEIWKNEFPKNLNTPSVELGYQEEVNYLSLVPSSLGRVRINVESATDRFTLYFSKTVHNSLMRGALLKKIGYKTPDMKYISKLVLRFEDESAKENFKQTLSEQLFGDAKNWIVSERETSLIVQDLVAMDSDISMYNLSLGHDLGEEARGRRLLRALIVPYALTNIPESLNLMSWKSARVVSGNILLDLKKSLRFNADRFDAAWISRRIFKLSRGDWKQIVAASNLPPSVQSLVLEKLIARRNSLGRAMDEDFRELPIYPEVNSGNFVVDGKIEKKNWEGYGRKMAFGDPESPLSSSDLTDYLKSRALSTALDGAMSSINSLPFMGTDISGRNQEEMDKIINDLTEQAESSEEAAPSEVPLKTWVYPTYRGGLKLSRNIVAGSYLGTDNLIQLVDSVGVSVSAGGFLGVGGLPVSAGVGGQAYFSRNYAHVKPIYSIKQALKYPFKNMIVPLFKRKIGKKLDELRELDEDESAKKVEEILGDFKESLDVGESLIVTDSLGAGISAYAGAGVIGELVDVQAGISPNASILSRLHIYRKSEDGIQIYKSFGNVYSINLSLTLKGAVPLVKADVTYSKGSAKTKFYRVPLKLSSEIESTLKALRAVFISNSVKQLETQIKPFVLKHKFSESFKKLGIFFLRLHNIDSHDRIELTTPRGEKRELFRRYDGRTQGLDYQAYAFDVASHLLRNQLSDGFSSTSGSNNPGYSFLGKAKNKILSYEAVKKTGEDFKKPFVKVSRIWNGWKMKKSKAIKVLRKIKDKYLFNYHPPEVLAQTEKLFLYNINVNFVIHPLGLEHMLNLSSQKAREIFSNYASKRPSLTSRLRSDRKLLYPYRKFIRMLKRAKKHKDNIRKLSKYTLKAVSIAEDNLNVYGMREIFGGEDHFYTFSRLDGFREGDEKGDQGIISNSLGSFGDAGTSGPVELIRKKMNMTEGEFLIGWILRRAI